MRDNLTCQVKRVGIWAMGFVLSLVAVSAAGDDIDPQIHIARPAPDPRGGQAYRLTYRVPLPLEIFWRFKTDFDNVFLKENKYIQEHRLVSRKGRVVITENIYTSTPSQIFRWQTTIQEEQHRLKFKLLKTPSQPHRFHYGTIQLEAEQGATRVTQTAYFDFAGAALWSWYPWYGGMRSFLEYTAEWEINTASRLRHHYEKQDSPTMSDKAAPRPSHRGK